MKSFVELSFMPDALASGTRTVFGYEANVTPPKDYKQWATLIERLVSHCVERYGEREVGEWLFEVWNEPNLKTFWTGTQREYFKLYRHTAEAIKNVSTSFKVGGPATARSEWIEEFVNFVNETTPADFVSTHYPNDGYEHNGDTEVNFSKASAASCDKTRVTTRATDRFITPNGTRRLIPSIHCTTSLTQQPSLPRPCWKHTGSSMVTASGPSRIFLKRIIFRQCRFMAASDAQLARHSGQRIARLNAASARRSVFACRRFARNCRLFRGSEGVERDCAATNHTTPGHSIETEDVHVRLDNAREPASIQRVDEDHANPKRVEEMGQPEYLSRKDVERLEEASQVVSEKQR